MPKSCTIGDLGTQLLILAETLAGPNYWKYKPEPLNNWPLKSSFDLNVNVGMITSKNHCLGCNRIKTGVMCKLFFVPVLRHM